MSNERHTTSIEVKADVSSAEAGIARLLDKLNAAAARADGLGVGGGSGGSSVPGSGGTSSTGSMRAPTPGAGVGGATGSTTGRSDGRDARGRFLPGGATASTADDGIKGTMVGGPSVAPSVKARAAQEASDQLWTGRQQAAEARHRAFNPLSGGGGGVNQDWTAKVNAARTGGLLGAMSPGGNAMMPGGGTLAALGMGGVHLAGGGLKTLAGGPGAALSVPVGGIVSMLKKIKHPAAAVAAAALALAGGAGAMGLNKRMGLAGDAASLEQAQMRTVMAATGLNGATAGINPTDYDLFSKRINYQHFARQWGVKPQEAARTYESTSVGLGLPGLGMRDLDTVVDKGMSYRATGGSMSTLVGLGRTFGPGGGAKGGLKQLARRLSTAGGLTQELGLSGARADELIQSLTGTITGRSGAGLLTDETGLVESIKGLHQTGIAAVSGTGAGRAGARLMQAATGAGQAFGANFAGLGQAALMGYAFQGAKSPQEAMRRLNGLQDPESVRNAMRSQLGKGDALELALYGQGESAQSARGIMGFNRTPVTDQIDVSGAARDAALPLSQAQAQGRAARLAKMDVAQSKRLIEFMDQTERAILNFAGPTGTANAILATLKAAMDLARLGQ